MAQVLRAGVLLTYVFLDVAAALEWLPLTALLAQIISVPSVICSLPIVSPVDHSVQATTLY